MRFMNVALACALAASCIPGLGAGHSSSHNSAKATAKDDDGPKVVSAQSGSKTAAAYDDTTELLARADDEEADAPSPIPGHKHSAKLIARIKAYGDAEKRSADMLALVKEMKGNGSWAKGLKYAVTGKETLTEKEILQRLDDMHTRATEGRDKLAPQLDKAFHKEFPKVSAAQLEALDKYGLPIEIKPGKKGEACWKFETDSAWPTSCWKKTGALASHTEKAKPHPVVAAEDAQPEGSSGSSGESGGVPWVHSGSDCRALVSHNSGLCDSNDCRALASNNSGLCDSNDCRALASNNSGLCDSNDCRAVASNNSGLCDSNDCRAIASHNSGLCDTNNCRAIASGNSGLCD